MRASAPFLLLPLLLAALLGVPAPVARAGDDVVLSYSETWYAVLDPAWTRYPNDERLLLALYDCLTARDPASGKIVPAAAERWEEAADGRSWTFHLRRGAKWSDGSPVKASDFAAAWRRAIDPFEPSVHAWRMRPLAGCAAIADGDRAMRAFSAAGKGIEDLLEEHGDGIPGKALDELLERTGVRPLAAALDDADVKRALAWGPDRFPADKAKGVQEAFKEARRGYKRQVYDAFDAFGKDVGVKIVDDLTLVVLLEGRCPWLPELVARPLFAPLHPKTVRGGEHAFAPAEFLANGAYTLKGRGPKPRPGLANPMSLVHLVRNPTYDGPRPGKADEIFCYTGQQPEEDLRRLENGELQWMANARHETRKATDKLSGRRVRGGGELVLLRFRVDRPPFDREEVRRALALTLDRARLAKQLWPPAREAATLLPPAVDARAPEAPPADVAAAKKILEKAGLAGADFPWVELLYEDRPGSGHDDLADELLRQWEKGLGVEMGLKIAEVELARALRQAGAFQVALGTLEGPAGDPAAWVLPLADAHPESGLGWKDEGFAALLAAAADVDAFLAGGEEALARLPDAEALKPKVLVARGSERGREDLRLALLQAAQARALGACVVVPLLWPDVVMVEKAVRGLGSESAWRHPTFHGSLRPPEPTR